MLRLSEVTRTFKGPKGTVGVLDNVSLQAEAERFVAVRGPSGCGKTTLLLCAGGLLRPDRGTVSVDGQDLYALAPDARARYRGSRIGFVFQQFHLVPYLSVLDNVMAPLLAIDVPDARNRAMDLIERMGLTHRQHHVPPQLSTGERQRTALARALLPSPKLILADEPTGNLDDASAEVVLGHLAEFAKSGGAVLLVTHDVRAARYADQTLSLVGGRLGEAAVAGDTRG